MASGTQLRITQGDISNLKRYILFGRLLFSNKLFSQTISLSDFISNWKWGSGGKQYIVMAFLFSDISRSIDL